MKPKIAIAFRASADTSNIRTETFDGRTYTVVPVVALVEGVIQSMNSPKPELVRASEFGKFCVGWDGRPVVMSHPVDADLNPLSANSPAVLETYQIGYVFNTHVDGTKLIQEAWIDNDKAETLSDDTKAVIEALQAGEILEVSTGLYTTVVNKSGYYNNEAYSGEWEGIVPDHLAILPKGVIGACSVEDGCGTNRMNSSKGIQPIVIKTDAWRNFAAKSDSCDCGCGTCGGSKDMAHKHNDSSNGVGGTATQTGTSKVVAAPSLDDVLTSVHPIGSLIATPDKSGAEQLPGGTGNAVSKTSVITPSIFARILSAVTGKSFTESKVTELATPHVFSAAEFLADQIKANGAPSDMMSSDIYTILQAAITDLGRGYIIGFTGDKVVYTISGWDYDDGYISQTYQRSYTISADGASVALGDDDEEVNLITKIVPVSNDNSAATQTMAVNEVQDSSNSAVNPKQEASDMADNKSTAGQAANSVKEVKKDDVTTIAGPDERGVTQVSEAIAAGGATGPAHSLETLLANASPELRESIQAGVRLHQQRKGQIIAGLKASGRCKFSDERLNQSTLEDLEAMASLANVPNYGGMAGAATIQANTEAAPGMRDSAGNGVPKVEPLFKRASA